MLKTHLFSGSYITDYMFPEYEQRTLYVALVVTLAMLLRLINRRFINIMIIDLTTLPSCLFTVTGIGSADSKNKHFK